MGHCLTDPLLAVIARGSVIPSASGLFLFPCKRQTGSGGAERHDPNLSLHKTLHDGMLLWEQIIRLFKYHNAVRHVGAGV